jgi:hypothetical protein
MLGMRLLMLQMVGPQDYPALDDAKFVVGEIERTPFGSLL